MECKNNPELIKLADHLAHPFMLPGQTGQPLSFRLLEDGGMVVIAPDGRKLWFTALEVCRARKELLLPPAQAPAPGVKAVLQDIDPFKNNLTYNLPMGRTTQDFSDLVIPESMNHIKERVDEHLRRTRITPPKHTRR